MLGGKVKVLGMLLLLLLIISCASEDILIIEETLECPPIGLGSAHPRHRVYQSLLEDLIEEGYPGVTASINDTHGLWLGSAGQADVKNRVEMQECHLGHSGSFAKMHTVTAALILAEKGMLNIDSKIENYLDSDLADNLPNGRTATVRQLMNHSAGMPDHDDEKGLSDYGDKNDQHLPSAKEQLAYLFDNEPRFEAGSKSQYSSAHTLTLSLILDTIYGAHHSHVISREVIDKIGLNETYYKNEIGYPAPINMSKGYMGRKEDVTLEAMNYANDSQGDAGVIASSHDFYLFLKALMEYRILSRESVDEMLEPFWWVEFGSDEGIGFGLGPFLVKKNGEIIKIGHGGITIGGMTHVYYYPKQNAYISIMTNTATLEDNGLYESWAGNLAINPNGNSIIEKFENIIFK